MNMTNRISTRCTGLIAVCLIATHAGLVPAGAAKAAESSALFLDVKTLRERVDIEPSRSAYLQLKSMLEQSDVATGPERLPLFGMRAATKADTDDPQRLTALRLANTGSSLMQIAAIVHAVENDDRRGTQAKTLLLRYADDWRRKLPNLEKRHPGPALDVSRNLRNYCVVFDLLRQMGSLPEDEVAAIREGLAAAALRLMERGTNFNPYDYMSERYRPDNWNSDRFASVGLFALTFPEYDKSAEWLKHVQQEFDWQLNHCLRANGAWPEGTRYHGAVLRAFIPLVTALRNRGVADYYTDANFKAMFQSFMSVQSPRDVTLGGIALTPGASSANWENGWSTCLGRAAAGFARSDPTFAENLMWAWRRAGAPFAYELSPGNLFGLVFVDPTIESIAPPPLADEVLGNGFVVFRDGFDTDHESMLLFATATRPLPFQHQHRDNTSISLYAWNTPLAVDPGVQNYGPSMNEWYVRSKAHNMVVFGDEDTVENTNIEHVFFDEHLKYADAALARGDQGTYHRRILVFEPGGTLIWDAVGNAQNAVYHLHVLTEETKRRQINQVTKDNATLVHFPCQNNINLDVHVLVPGNASADSLLTVSNDPYPVGFYAESRGIPQLVYERTAKWLQLRQPGGGDFVTLLCPSRQGKPPTRVRPIQAEGPVVAVQLETGQLMTEGVRTTVYLGGQGNKSQGDKNVQFTGTGTVARIGASSKNESFYLIEGTRLSAALKFELTSSRPVSLKVSKTAGPSGYEITHLAGERTSITFTSTANGQTETFDQDVGGHVAVPPQLQNEVK